MGLDDQQYDVRTPCRQPRESSQERLKRARESQVWPQASHRVGRAPAGVRWVRVADREADIDEYWVSCQALGHGLVIRAAPRSCLKPSRDGEAYGAIMHRGSQRVRLL